MSKSDWGEGTLYKRAGSRRWYGQFFVDGKRHQFSTGTDDERKARRVLREKLTERENAGGGATPGDMKKTRYEQLRELIVDSYLLRDAEKLERNKGSKVPVRESIKDLKVRLRHLDAEFKGRKAAQITKRSIIKYRLKRKNQGAAIATINREVAALRRMFNLGLQEDPPLVNRVPKFEKHPEAKERKGFLEESEFRALHRELDDQGVRGAVLFAYYSGWRLREVLDLTWSEVDLREGVVILPGERTKNGEDRVYVLNDELWELLRENKKLMRRWVFPSASGGRIYDLRKAWSRACRAAGLGYGYKLSREYVRRWSGRLSAGPIFHDLRRCAARNLIRSGVPRSVAKKITGHLSDSMYDRYNITSNDDIRAAVKAQANYLNSIRNEEKKIIQMG